MNDPHPLGMVAPEDTAMDLKCIVAVPVVRYLTEQFGVDRAGEILAATKMSGSYLMDPHSWISFPYYCRLLAKLVETTGDPSSPFTAAERHSDPQSFGSLYRLLEHLGSPGAGYALVVRFARLWSRVNDWTMEETGKNSCRISVKPTKYPQDKNNCLAIRGSLAAGPRAFGLPSATVRELQCACEGAEACVHEISWINKPEARYGLVGLVAGLVFGFAICVAAAWHPATAVASVLLGPVAYLAGRLIDYRIRLKQVYAQNERQAEALVSSLRDAERFSEGLQNQVVERTGELTKANAELAQALQDLRQSEARKLIAERQATVGVLAAGMAHELNSPLNAIRISIQMLLEELGTDSTHAPYLRNAERATGNCKRIIDELLSLSREAHWELDVRIEGIVEKSIELFLREHPSQTAVEKSIAGELPKLILDRRQIQQAVLNLLYNASEAMNGKGTVKVSLLREGDSVALRIADQGPGLSAEAMRNLFVPFYTTKREGHGMGLSITSQLIRRNGGTMEVESRPGEGAVFSVKFPVRSTTPGRRSQ